MICRDSGEDDLVLSVFLALGNLFRDPLGRPTLLGRSCSPICKRGVRLAAQRYIRDSNLKAQALKIGTVGRAHWFLINKVVCGGHPGLSIPYVSDGLGACPVLCSKESTVADFFRLTLRI